jgi:large exoprotein involved in heme utilization and adhesion
MSNVAFLVVDTYGTGDAGSVNINARDTVSFNKGYAYSDVNEGALGNGGSINITTRLLSVSNGAQLSADTYGTGDAGSVNINARDSVSFDGGYAFSSVEEEGAIGNGGSINITTGSLFVSNGARLSGNTYGRGNAGSVNINARDTVSFDGGDAFSDVKKGALGNGGSINITTGSLFVSNGALLSTSTYGTGDAGSVNINARDTVSLDGVDSNGLHSSAFSFVGKEAIGNGGSINITTGSFSVSNGALLSTSTFGTGDAGSVNINARDTVSFDRSEAFSLVRKGAIGNGGSINITTGSLFVSNGALLGTSTYGTGDAGSVNINAGDTVSFDGAYAFSDVNEGAIGNGGSINITTGSLFVSNGGGLSASSRGNSVAGNIEVAARSVRLDNQGAIIAATSSGDGGNIALRVKDLLLMRHESQISTTAGTAQAGGDGGNITIDTDFIVAIPKEDSNITANAFTGRGGNINITAQGIYGIEFRPKNTPLSDITASSQFGVNGVVTINTPDVDPSRGLANLPNEPVNVEVTEGCQADGKQASVEFFNTGRGGLAPNPYESLSSSNIWEDVPLPTQGAANPTGAVRASASPATAPDKIVEAQGWRINEKGEVVLVAEMPATRSQSRCRLR